MTATQMKSFYERYAGVIRRKARGRIELKPDVQAVVALVGSQISAEYMRRYQASMTDSKDETVQKRAKGEREFSALAMEILKVVVVRCSQSFDAERMAEIESYVTTPAPAGAKA